MLSKPALNESLSSLDAAASALAHAPTRPQTGSERGGAAVGGVHGAAVGGGGGGVHGWAGLGGAVGVGTCAAWVERTRGDLLFGNKQYDGAYLAYLAALNAGIGDGGMVALLHVDLGAATHLSAGAQASRVQEHYGRAVKMMPGLEAHLVLGTMGTYNWGENARVTIEARLKQLAISQAGQEACAWHAALGLFLARRRQHLGRTAPHTCKQTVWIFCRLRGQTPGTGRTSEKSEPKYIYYMKPHCVLTFEDVPVFFKKKTDTTVVCPAQPTSLGGPRLSHEGLGDRRRRRYIFRES